jgi:hypothetical protein
MSKKNSLFTSGFNDWKHGHKLLHSHENSKQHTDSMVALCARKASGGCVDDKSVKVDETIQ